MRLLKSDKPNGEDKGVGGFSIRSTYRIELNVGNPQKPDTVVHIMRAMDDEAYALNSARGATLPADPLEREKAFISGIRAAHSNLLISVEGYDGIPNGEVLTDEQKAAIPYKHAEIAYGQLMVEERVVPGEPQKNLSGSSLNA